MTIIAAHELGREGAVDSIVVVTVAVIPTSRARRFMAARLPFDSPPTTTILHHFCTTVTTAHHRSYGNRCSGQVTLTLVG